MHPRAKRVSRTLWALQAHPLTHTHAHTHTHTHIHTHVPLPDEPLSRAVCRRLHGLRYAMHAQRREGTSTADFLQELDKKRKMNLAR